LAGKRAYFAAISLFRNRLLSRTTKILLYKTLVRPIVTYGAETWTMTKKEEQAMLIFERKIFRRIYGAKYEDGEWKIRTNRELQVLSKGENTVMDKGAKDKLAGSPGENGGGQDAQKDLH
jgi:hypothetical protein